MSGILYNRKAELLITKRTGGETLRITDLRIAFSIMKSSSSEANTAKITISNLSEQSRNLLREIGEVAVLSAGYDEVSGPEIIFKGGISNIRHLIEPPEVSTVLECDDGQKVFNDTIVSLSYGANVKAKQIIGDIIKKTPLPVRVNIGKLAVTDVTLTQGFSFIGSSKDALDKLAKLINVEWSSHNEEFKLVPVNASDLTRSLIINSETGLLDSPERLNKITNDKDTSFKGWKVKSLLQPKAEPGGTVFITSKEIPDNSKFKIDRVDHQGDTHGLQWFSTLQVKQI